MDPHAWPDSTLVERESSRYDTASTWVRRVFLTVLTGALVAGLVGLLGVRHETADASGGGWELHVDYPAVGRAGLDTHVAIEVRRTGGFDGPVTLAIDADYFRLYETQGFLPEPDSSTRQGDLLLLTFTAPPDGDVLRIDYDAYLEPELQRGEGATVAVLERGLPVVSTSIRTRIVP